MPTRAQLRADVLDGLGDLRRLTATADGSDVTFIDAANLVGEPGAYTGREFLCTAAANPANVGQIRYVTGSSQDVRAIGFGDALPASTMAGDTGELVNLRGTGYRVVDVHAAINRAIAAAAGAALQPIALPADAPFDLGTSTLSIPAVAEALTGVEWLAPSGSADVAALWRPVRKARTPGGDGWSVDRATRTITIGGRTGYTLHGQSVRLLAMGEPAPLNTDADTTLVNGEWLVAEAKAQLLESGFLRQPTPERERFAFLARQQANVLRSRVLTRQSPWAVRL